MKVVEKLAAELQIQFPAEAGDPLTDVLRLQLHIFGIVKTRIVHTLSPCSVRRTAAD